MVDRTNSERPEALAARQREHRLQERVKPKQPAPPNTDPWLIADEALDLLDRAERRLRHLRLPADELEEIGELLRRLAWGLKKSDWRQDWRQRRGAVTGRTRNRR